MNSISIAADFGATQKQYCFRSGWSVSDLHSRVSVLTHSWQEQWKQLELHVWEWQGNVTTAVVDALGGSNWNAPIDRPGRSPHSPLPLVIPKCHSDL